MIDTPPQAPVADDANSSELRYISVPKWAVLSPELPSESFQLYSLLLALVDAHGGDGRVSLAQGELADLAGYTSPALISHLNVLRELGVVEVEEAGDASIYTVHREPPAGWRGPTSLDEFYASLDGGAE
jgi:hypothetical protein